MLVPNPKIEKPYLRMFLKVFKYALACSFVYCEFLSLNYFKVSYKNYSFEGVCGLAMKLNT